MTTGEVDRDAPAAAGPAPEPAGPPEPALAAPPRARPSWTRWLAPARWLRELAPRRLWARVRAYYRLNEPTTLVTYTPLLLLGLVLFTRAPWTNYIFDEQEALLANPFVNRVDGLTFWDVIHRDFWGLPPDASIGSYRPIPSALWWLLWTVSKHPFFHHLYNIVLHALNGALLGAFAWAVTKRRDVAWLTATIFTTCALLTEAVSGIVGIADVLGGLGAIAALQALRLPAWGMPLGVFASVLFSLFSKESGLVCVPLVPFVALLTAHALHPERPARVARALLAFAAALGAFVLYVELRKQWFPSPLPEALTKPLPPNASRWQMDYRELLVWFQQAPLPNDPINNPLVKADFPHRLAGALRVYWRGLGQVVLPWRLSGDYSFPQEPIPKTLWGWETIAGGVMMVLPLLYGAVMPVVGWLRELGGRRFLAATAARTGGSEPTTPAPTAPRSMPGGSWARLAGRGWRPWLLGAAFALGVAALVGFDTEIFLLLRGGPSWVVTWPWSVGVMVVALGLLVEGWRSPRTTWTFAGPRPLGYVAPMLLAAGAVWLVVSYFPHSNIPILLPTVRAERFWYFPAIGSSLWLAVAFAWLIEPRARAARVAAGTPHGPAPTGTTAPERAQPGGPLSAALGKLLARPLEPPPPVPGVARRWTAPWKRWGWRVTLGGALCAAFLTWQCARTYAHAMDYRDDLAFWDATKDAVPHSAKAHLNYSVMKGARRDLETRLVHSRIAAELAPDWPMAHIYTGDTLCRMHRADEAWPYYVQGFETINGDNERALIALALQCLWDEGRLKPHETELRAMAADPKHKGSWLAWLATDTLDNGEKNQGVEPKYRPRGYNEGPKKE